MGNMSYCRFRNTLNDMRDCVEAIQNREIESEEEQKAAKRLLKEMAQLLEQEEIIEEYDEKAIDSLIEDCE